MRPRQRVAPRASGSICFRVAVGFGLNIPPARGSALGCLSFTREEGDPEGGGFSWDLPEGLQWTPGRTQLDQKINMHSIPPLLHMICGRSPEFIFSGVLRADSGLTAD